LIVVSPHQSAAVYLPEPEQVRKSLLMTNKSFQSMKIVANLSSPSTIVMTTIQNASQVCCFGHDVSLIEKRK
jgi:hypothetical protein